ncbi:hypothetical protein QVD17_31973 [Tagetes erecta]|uniref:Band 7 domain-containing protein n=1 Tax=Tagetes erecta TaxID=13708 RepID=A0AAD8K4E6_TARER|nr:hypothetical protein QVD17_31973 [Tagetes erecta]
MDATGVEEEPRGTKVLENERKLVIVIGVIGLAFLFLMSLISCTLPNLWNRLVIVHEVPKGHVGVYWQGDVHQKTIANPGLHLKLPLITHYHLVKVTLHTDLVKDISCVTKWGVMINFETIEVINSLKEEYVHETILNYGVEYGRIWIYDKIRDEINKFCSAHSLHEVYIDMFDQIDETMKEALQAECTRYAPGIEIISVHVSKPIIPETLRRLYEQFKEERTKVLLLIERQRVVVKEAEKTAYISKMVAEHNLAEKKRVSMQEEISNAMYVKSLVDAKSYRSRTMKEAEANMLILTPQYLELKFIELNPNNAKMLFGNQCGISQPLSKGQSFKRVWTPINKSLPDVSFDPDDFDPVSKLAVKFFLDGKCQVFSRRKV